MGLLKSKYTGLIYTLLAMLICSSCAQLSSMMTGRTLEKGDTQITGGLVAIGVSETDSISAPPIVVPEAFVMVRRGLGNSFDAGLQASLGGSLKLDARKQLAGIDTSQRFALSAGYGIEVLLPTISDRLVSRHHLPIYSSYHFNSRSALYLTPRIVYQVVPSDDNALFYGSSLGYQRQINERITMALEGSLYGVKNIEVTSRPNTLYQAGMGIVWSLK